MSAPGKFFDGPTIRVACFLLDCIDGDNVVRVVDQEAAAACIVTVKEYRAILRRMEMAGMLTRQLHRPGRRKEFTPRTIQLLPNAQAWRGVTGWIALQQAEAYTLVELGAPPARTSGARP